MRSEIRSNDTPFWNGRRNRLDVSDDHQLAADEGRKVYVGGLPSFENDEDTDKQIRSLFEDFNVEKVSKLKSAQDAMREKPGNHNYCFVELASASEAEEAIETLNGKEIWDWRIKVNHTTGFVKPGEKRRLFVGGLPEFPDQGATEAGMKELFEGFEVSHVTKLFLPRESSEEREGHHCYCFVELADDHLNEKVIMELDWKEKWDGKVRVKPATSSPKKTGFGGWGTKKEKE
jgi:RNA recognition motif-containing protein